MQRVTNFFAIVLLSTGLVSGMAYAQQDTATADGGAQAEVQASSFSDQQLMKFADASKEIAMLNQEYAGRLQSAEGDEAQQQVRQEANDKMIQAVETQGLSVETFNAVGEAIQNDPELLQKVQEMAQVQQ
ncbi:DUF4168 domain-containing protein [Halomonas halocynthiae]|uniref:DUF4168 domain-containing protein n=1 Tax=Halomonas halocynthiae TaxID=176290 RepID=UPI000428706E|nr:DUF4168 domain-containing protein [Halomonas halocynthiae]